MSDTNENAESLLNRLRVGINTRDASIVSLRQANDHLMAEVDQLVMRNRALVHDLDGTTKQLEDFRTQKTQRTAWVKSWAAAHEQQIIYNDVAASCIIDLIDGLHHIADGTLHEFKPSHAVEVTDPDGNVIARLSPTSDETIAEQVMGKNTAAPEPAPEGYEEVRRDEGTNHDHADPVRTLFSVLAQLLQSSDTIPVGHRIRFEFTKD
jgi:hypothetical protein